MEIPIRAVQRVRLIGSVLLMWDCEAGDAAAQEGRFVPAGVFPAAVDDRLQPVQRVGP
jgi:hypothetical protein